MTSMNDARAGVGLKPEHFREAFEADAAGFWTEAHPENYMVDGGPRLSWLERVRSQAPLSLHGVGASLGSTGRLDKDHLQRLKALVDRFEPMLVSEHVAWSAHDARYFADLLPLPTTHEALHALCDNIDEMQSFLGRRILVENPALYVEFRGELAEPDFLSEVCARTGCGLLLDINNVFVSAHNLERDAAAYLNALPSDIVGEYHLAGHAPDEGLGGALLIDTHGAPVSAEVWALYEIALARFGPAPTLIERDENIPSFDALMAERARADALLVARQASFDDRATVNVV